MKELADKYNLNGTFANIIWVRLDKSIKKRSLLNGLRFEQTDVTVDMDGSSGLALDGSSSTQARTTDGGAFIAGYTKQNHTVEWRIPYEQWRTYAIEGIDDSAEERIREFLIGTELGRKLLEISMQKGGKHAPLTGGYPAFIGQAVVSHQPRPSIFHLRPHEYGYVFAVMFLVYFNVEYLWPPSMDSPLTPWHQSQKELIASTEALKELASAKGLHMPIASQKKQR
jgi:hypothetical protein